MPGMDGALVALDAKTGKVVWEAKLEDWKQGYYTTAAAFGCEGQSAGRHCRRRVRRARVCPGVRRRDRKIRLEDLPRFRQPGEPGSETWQKADTWKTGGGAMWMTGNYDPATNTIYWGVGNGSPWFGDQRPGDIISTASLDMRTGRRHRQDQGVLPVPPERVLGLGRHECADAGRTSRKGRRTPEDLLTPQPQWLPLLARAATADGSISYLDSEGYVPQNVFKSIDPKTGRPDVDTDHKPATGKKAIFSRREAVGRQGLAVQSPTIRKLAWSISPPRKSLQQL